MFAIPSAKLLLFFEICKRKIIFPQKSSISCVNMGFPWRKKKEKEKKQKNNKKRKPDPDYHHTGGSPLWVRARVRRVREEKMPQARHGGRSDWTDKGVGDFIIVKEGIKLPRPKGRISLSVRGYVVGGFVAGLELRLHFRRSTEFG